jgi:hypothetical protein
MALEIPGAKQAGDTDKNAAEKNAIENWPYRAGRGDAKEEGHPGGKLQKDREAAREDFILAHADPNDRSAFQCPRGGSPTPVERQRNRQRAEDNAESEERFNEQVNIFTGAPKEGFANKR